MPSEMDKFDKMFDNAFNHPSRAIGFVLLLNLVLFVIGVAVIVGAILFLKAHGVF